MPERQHSTQGERRSGQVWRYYRAGRGRGNRRRYPDPTGDLRLTRPGLREGDWLGIRLHPTEGFAPDFEFVLAREQFETGRYMLVEDTADG